MDSNACDTQCPLAPGARREGSISRRTFFIHATVAAAGVTLVACGGLGGSAPTAPQNVSLTITLSDYPSLANVGGVANINANGAPVAVVRTSNTAFVALSRICPHQGGTVNAVNGGFLCPNHGAEFDDTGRWIGGQPTGNLTTYATSYDATAGTLTIG